VIFGAIVDCAERRIMLKNDSKRILEIIRGSEPDGCMDSFLYSLNLSQKNGVNKGR